ncbi:MAG: alpha/beta hydrolase [Burkholderiales bacterium]|nr:alpha/beta hydrolase [Flavobacterium sp.]
MKRIFASLLFLLSCITFGQVTLKITSIPSNTPANATIYIAGDFNTWDPGNAAYTMQSDGLGAWQIVIPEGTGTIGFKFTRGSWPTVEGNANGSYLPNRTLTFTGVPQNLNLTILSWEDISGSGTASTAAANVQILNNAFFMPQLNTSRKIWLYLPPDYNSSTKTYPVLYMADGQNLFDNATSFSGEWQVDETLNTLFAQGDYGAIVVGIDNGGGERLNEYSPWFNAQYNAGGDGEAYMQFVAATLKPYIDSNFRTKPQPQFNALIGSSMGALISVYGACALPATFQKVGAFSPAFWFSLGDLNNYILNDVSNVNALRLYFVAGQNESTTMVPNINIVRNNLISKGVLTANTLTKIDAFGTHTESYWRGEFGAAYQWLFSGTNLSTNDSPIVSVANIQQNGSGEIQIKGLTESVSFDVISISGQKIQTIELANGTHRISGLASGVYFLKSEKTPSLKIVVR